MIVWVIAGLLGVATGIRIGWALVNIVMFPGVAIAGVMLLWLGLRDRRRVA